MVHARWVLQQLRRDEAGALTMGPGAEAAILSYLEACSPEDQIEAVDQLLRLAHGVYSEAQEVALARQLVAAVLACPRGRALLGESPAGQAWARFAESAGTQMAAPNEPPPKGAVKVGGLGLKIRA